jgi:hypothetical protein
MLKSSEEILGVVEGALIMHKIMQGILGKEMLTLHFEK